MREFFKNINGIPLYTDINMKDGEVLKGRKQGVPGHTFMIANPKTAELLYMETIEYKRKSRKQKLEKICGINLQQRLKQLKVGDKLICIKEKITGYRLGEYYEIEYVSGRVVGVQTDYHLSYSYYTEIYENECYECLWDYFGSLKDIRKKKLKKLKFISDEESG